MYFQIGHSALMSQLIRAENRQQTTAPVTHVYLSICLSFQVVYICWSMMKSTLSRCLVHMHAPSSLSPGWNWAVKSTSAAPSRATRQSSLSRLNHFTVANYTSESLPMLLLCSASCISAVTTTSFVIWIVGGVVLHQKLGNKTKCAIKQTYGLENYARSFFK